MGREISDSYPTTLSGNKYIICCVDWYSGWPEAFAVPDKSAETVVHVVLDEIIHGHRTPLETVTDNGTENINKVMKFTLEQMNISHVTTSYYHPQGNSKVERFCIELYMMLCLKWLVRMLKLGTYISIRY